MRPDATNGLRHRAAHQGWCNIFCNSAVRFAIFAIVNCKTLRAAFGATMDKSQTCWEFFAKDTWFRNLIDQARTYFAVLSG